MKSKLFLFSLLSVLPVLVMQAARVDTINVQSPSMKRSVKVVYIIPCLLYTSDAADDS